MTTFVFGAGASHHAGYPLASKLGDALLDWAQRADPISEFHGQGVRDLSDLYGNLGNLEQILAELDDCSPGSPVENLSREHRARLRQNIRVAICELFNRLRSNPAPVYERWVHDKVSPGDVVITFNYDLACERELKRAGLWEINDGYGFELGIDTIPKSAVTVLKLHGSANWLEVFFGGQRGFLQFSGGALGSRPVILPGHFSFFGYPPELRDPLTPAQPPGAVPAIIVPTLNKRFYEHTSWGRELEDFWDDLWRQAGNALRASAGVIVIGYSMAAADQKARELLLKNSNRDADIEVFCGRSSPAIMSEFAAHGFAHVSTLGKSYFEDYLHR